MFGMMGWIAVAAGSVAICGLAQAAVSPELKVDQVGFGTTAQKIALATTRPVGDIVVRKVDDNTEALRLTPRAAVHDRDSGDDVVALDLSSIKQPGRYVVSAAGIGESQPFTIGDEILAKPLRTTMRSFYGQRCGMAVDLGPDFPDFKHDACHLGLGEFHVSSGKTGTKDVSGGWHDAGDFGRYIVNSGITTGTLLWAYELNPTKLKSFDLSIPESGGKIPDFLAEIKWNLDWMLKMQDDDGGVWHKATSAQFCGMIMPEKDTLPVLIIGSGQEPYKTTEATADFAAVAAIGARVYAPFDPEYAAKCRTAAERAWDWLQKTPDAHYRNNPPGISTGGYSGNNSNDERLWAAAELFRSTGNASCNAYFVEHYKGFNPTINGNNPQGWGDVEHLAMYTYAMSGRADTNPEAVATIKADAIRAADEIAARSQKHPYRLPMLPNQYIWGSNSVVMNYAMMLQLGNRIQPKPEYTTAALDCLHYVLGRNAFSTSFVTQVGTKWAMRPHNRPSAADGIDQPWPGLLVGGPNAGALRPPQQRRGQRPAGGQISPATSASTRPTTRPAQADASQTASTQPATTRPAQVASTRPATTAPVAAAKSWLDETGNFTTNENAINWNAPLVFVLAEAMK